MISPDLIGLTGVAAYLAAYGLLQFRRLEVEDTRYLALNAYGSAALLYSLAFDFNLASVLSQGMWMAFTLVGYWRNRRVRLTAQALPTA